jgi:hypothetical protein
MSGSIQSLAPDVTRLYRRLGHDWPGERVGEQHILQQERKTPPPLSSRPLTPNGSTSYTGADNPLSTEERLGRYESDESTIQTSGLRLSRYDLF